MAQYQVVKPLVITKKEDGSDLYLYLGAVLPDFVSDDEVKRLSDEGFVEKLGSAAAREALAEEAPEVPADLAEAVKARAKKSEPSAPSN
jgi:hypothetical protein